MAQTTISDLIPTEVRDWLDYNDSNWEVRENEIRLSLGYVEPEDGDYGDHYDRLEAEIKRLLPAGWQFHWLGQSDFDGVDYHAEDAVVTYNNGYDLVEDDEENEIAE